MREGRAHDQMRTVHIDTGFHAYAEGSALIDIGRTRVWCTATIEDGVPTFKKNTGSGWVTAEYSMLPRSTHTRNRREAATGRQGGRTLEIQRLIGRSLRSVVNLDKLGEHTIILDCDVLQADGGTRCAAITASWVALRLAVDRLISDGRLSHDPITGQIAAVSCGIVQGKALLDLEYSEDSQAEMDVNFVLACDGGIVEFQATAEEEPMSWDQFLTLKRLADKGIRELCALQRQAILDPGPCD
jgi:ribonuclease PH